VLFTALQHHITPPLLVESLYEHQRDVAPGVHGMTWREYESVLYERVNVLHRQLHAGSYRAQPSRRVYIPKADGRQRPLGIASLEDKIVQQAIATILSAVYEEDFLGFSYGFRRGRGQHIWHQSGRGRDGGCPPPPAQIRTCIPANIAAVTP
jgi:retron-type reverse transcriptase